jgi:hypothetical protein
VETDKPLISAAWSGCYPKLCQPPRLDRLCAILDDLRAIGQSDLVQWFLDQLRAHSRANLFEVVLCRWLLHRAHHVKHEPRPAHNPAASPPDFRVTLDGITIDFQAKFLEQVENEVAVRRFEEQLHVRFGRHSPSLYFSYAIDERFSPTDINPTLEWIGLPLKRQPLPLDEWLTRTDAAGRPLIKVQFWPRGHAVGIVPGITHLFGSLTAGDREVTIAARRVDLPSHRKKVEELLENSKKSFHNPPGDSHFNVVVLGGDIHSHFAPDDMADVLYGPERATVAATSQEDIIFCERRPTDGLFGGGRKRRISAMLFFDADQNWLGDEVEFTWFLNPIHKESLPHLRALDPNGRFQQAARIDWGIGVAPPHAASATIALPAPYDQSPA